MKNQHLSIQLFKNLAIQKEELIYFPVDHLQ